MDIIHRASVFEKGVYIVHTDDLKTTPEITINFNSEKSAIKDDDEQQNKEIFGSATLTIVHYIILVVLGLITWGFLWCAFGDGWSWDGRWFKLVVVAAMAWVCGQALQMTTTLPPLMAALLTGIFARNVGYLDMREYTEVDSFLRRIYPVIILGKGSLAWDVNYMKRNWKLVASLGVLPWTTEVITLAVCMHVFLDYPWMWGFLLGSIHASVSCAVIMPTVQKLTVGKNLSQNWPQLICTAGGTDMALSVGVYGVINSFMMHDGDEPYKYVKAVLALVVGVVGGVSWGCLSKFIPHSKDFFVAELRLLFVLIGGLFIFFLSGKFGWGGAGGVAILACNSTAAKFWEKDGWKLNKNPASTAYRVMWSSLEPLVFAYSGTFIVIRESMVRVMLVGLGILAICLLARLTVAYLVCAIAGLSIRERIFVCCTWIPKSKIEAVLCPVAFNALIARGQFSEAEMDHANTFMQLTIQAILITTPIGFVLTNFLGPKLLKENNEKHNVPRRIPWPIVARNAKNVAAVVNRFGTGSAVKWFHR